MPPSSVHRPLCGRTLGRHCYSGGIPLGMRRLCEQQHLPEVSDDRRKGIIDLQLSNPHVTLPITDPSISILCSDDRWICGRYTDSSGRAACSRRWSVKGGLARADGVISASGIVPGDGECGAGDGASGTASGGRSVAFVGNGGGGNSSGSGDGADHVGGNAAG